MRTAGKGKLVRNLDPPARNVTAIRALYNDGDFCRELEVPDRQSTGPEQYRSAFRRDYARLIHSPAFRRLQGKTQVFPTHESDFFRNRLTHSLEVAQIAHSIAVKLNYAAVLPEHIDLDLINAAALAHDLGHPPFGHNGEKALDDRMKACGGFEGNAQTFHIICRVEKKEVRKDFPRPMDHDGIDQRIGLNWCYRSLASVVKYDRIIPGFRQGDAPLCKGIYESDSDILRNVKENVCADAGPGQFNTIEASIMDIADDIAYSTYDLEDALKSELLDPLDILSSRTSLLERVAKKVGKATKLDVTPKDVLKKLFDTFASMAASRRLCENPTEAELIELAVEIRTASRSLSQDGYIRTRFTADLVSEFISAIEHKVDDVFPMLSSVDLRPDAKMKVECIKNYVFESTIMSPRLRVAEWRGYDVVSNIFRALDSTKGYLLMPDDFRSLYETCIEDAARKRVVCDFIAGMTDRYAVEFYGRLTSENPSSIFKTF